MLKTVTFPFLCRTKRKVCFILTSRLSDTIVHFTIDALKTGSLDLWTRSSTHIPQRNHSYTAEQQLQKEVEIDRLMREVDTTASIIRKQGKCIEKKNRLEVRSRIQRAIVQLLHSFDCIIDDEMEMKFSAVTDEFVRCAYDFDPTIGDEEVYQASRNVLIMNSIQMYLGREICLTPSVFAYSMLYPYTDNYLDALDVDIQMKREANDRLLLRLNGIAVPAHNSRERTIDRLVCMIEQEFDRNDCPQVFESMIAIHQGQTRSVFQFSGIDLTPDDLLDISIEKGGTSVLADGYLVAGDLSEADAVFLFRFGVLLQLIDDLQDIEEDRCRNQRTLAGALACQKSLHSFTNHLLSFLDVVAGPIEGEQSAEARKFRTLIEQSCRLLIFEAIAANKTWYDNLYIEMMQHHSPVRFVYLQGIQERLRKAYTSPQVGTSAKATKSKNFSRKQMLEFVCSNI